jgi:hypothetical protein
LPEIAAADYHRWQFEEYLLQQRQDPVLLERTMDVVPLRPPTPSRDYTHYSTEVMWRCWKKAIDRERESLKRPVVGTAT